MNDGGLRYRSYRWRDGDEWLAEIGNGPTILFAPPLLEELNRCRAFIVSTMHEVANAGFRAVLPDLPATGESSRKLTDIGWHDWTGALATLTTEIRRSEQVVLLASFRGGCLIEEEAAAMKIWRFAPAAGSALARDLIRTKQATSPVKLRSEEIQRDACANGGEFAGYSIPSGLFAALANAPMPESPNARTIRLASDPGEAALKLEGRPLWRQAEPGTDAALSVALGRDIAAWAASCVA